MSAVTRQRDALAVRVTTSTGEINQQGEWQDVGRMLAPNASATADVEMTDAEGERTIASVAVTLGEQSEIALQAGLKPAQLAGTVVLSNIRSEAASEACGVAYLGMREGRIRRRAQALVFLSSDQAAIASDLRLKPLRHASPVVMAGCTYAPFAQSVDYAMYHAFERVDSTVRSLLHHEMTSEIVRTSEHWLHSFFARPWARAITDHTLTREQYVSTLFNLHCFVRWTSRLLGRAISVTPDQGLRDHFIYHLKGEINHEKIIERDLEYLGEDVEYLRHAMQPHEEIRAFMAIQESVIGFYADPALFLACPIAAEGVAAYIRRPFLDALYETIAGWGIKDPQKAARFITSHTNFDGGDDGHWNRTVLQLQQQIQTEARQRAFLGVLRTAMNALERGYDVNVEELRLYEA